MAAEEEDKEAIRAVAVGEEAIRAAAVAATKEQAVVGQEGVVAGAQCLLGRDTGMHVVGRAW